MSTSAALAATPQPARPSFNDTHESSSASLSAENVDMFSPRSAAAVALSHFSRQTSQTQRPTSVSLSTTNAAPSSAPLSVSSLSSVVARSETHTPAARALPPPPISASARRVSLPEASGPPHSGPRQQSQLPSPSVAGVRFSYPPMHFGPHQTRMHPMVVGPGPPNMAWTPQHRMNPTPLTMSGDKNKPIAPAPMMMCALMPPHHMSYFPAWEPPQHPSMQQLHQQPQGNFFPSLVVSSAPVVPNSMPSSTNGKTRPADQSLVTPTPKKMRTDEQSYNRKKKSLGLLAETFLSRFANADVGEEIYIDQLAEQLVVERRRVYDIVNILDSLKVVVKKGKNAYHWMGTDHLPRMFAILQHDAIFDHADDAFTYGIISEKPSPEEIHAAQANQDAQGSKSLSRLSQLFLRCYLVGHTTLSLPEASDKIHGEVTTVQDLAFLGCKNRCQVPDDPKLYHQAAMRGLKTKIRRLYDIANVFIAMGLLIKVDERSMPLETRRPRFNWCFHLSAKQIYELYRSMPDQAKSERNPFPENVSALLESSKSPKTPSRGVGVDPNMSMAAMASLSTTRPLVASSLQATTATPAITYGGGFHPTPLSSTSSSLSELPGALSSLGSARGSSSQHDDEEGVTNKCPMSFINETGGAV